MASDGVAGRKPGCLLNVKIGKSGNYFSDTSKSVPFYGARAGALLSVESADRP